MSPLSIAIGRPGATSTRSRSSRVTTDQTLTETGLMICRGLINPADFQMLVSYCGNLDLTATY